MVPVATTTSVKSSGLGKSRQMPVTGRRGWGLEDPALLVTMFTFLFHFSPFLPYLHLFSPPLLPVSFPSLAKYWLDAAQNQFHSTSRDSAGVGVGGYNSVAWGRMGEGLSERGANQACNLLVSLSVSHRSP